MDDGSLQGRRALALRLATAFLLLWAAESANSSEPHPHQGLIPRFEFDGKPEVELTADDLKHIDSGELWTQSREEDEIGRGIGIRDIAAPPDVVFDQISDYEGYVGKVPMLYSLKSYSKESQDGVDIEKSTYLVKVIPGYYYEYYLEHRASKSKGVLVFFLDYERHGDFNDMQGKWYLEPHPTKTGWTRVYYQCDLKLWGYAPKIVKTLLTSKGLSSSISWVKRESEKRAPKMAPEAAHEAAVAFLGATALRPVSVEVPPPPGAAPRRAPGHARGAALGVLAAAAAAMRLCHMRNARWASGPRR